MIEAVLCFARKHLDIKEPNFHLAYEIRPYNPLDRNLGCFSLSGRMMIFNGYPSLNTIFHEAVHYRQWERGYDFAGETLKAKHIILKRQYNETHLPQFSYEEFINISYYNLPSEIEARETAFKLEQLYNEHTSQNRIRLKIVRDIDSYVRSGLSCHLLA